MSREIGFLNDFRADDFGFENGNNMVRIALVFGTALGKEHNVHHTGIYKICKMLCILTNSSLILILFILPEAKDFSNLKPCDIILYVNVWCFQLCF
jgi:hypothetical protein